MVVVVIVTNAAVVVAAQQQQQQCGARVVGGGQCRGGRGGAAAAVRCVRCWWWSMTRWSWRRSSSSSSAVRALLVVVNAAVVVAVQQQQCCACVVDGRGDHVGGVSTQLQQLAVAVTRPGRLASRRVARPRRRLVTEHRVVSAGQLGGRHGAALSQQVDEVGLTQRRVLFWSSLLRLELGSNFFGPSSYDKL